MEKEKEKITDEENNEIKEENSLKEDQNENIENQEGSEEDNMSDVDKLKDEITTLKEEKIRLLAEMENLRKRFEREKIDSIKFGSVNFAKDILSPVDNLERAILAIDKDKNHSQTIKNLIEGLIMVKKELSKVLEKNGVKKIDTLEKKFDPNLHQAMMEIENDDLEEGIIVQEIQSGYTMHDRLLRPAMVGLSKKSKQNIGPKDNVEPDKMKDDKKGTPKKGLKNTKH